MRVARAITILLVCSIWGWTQSPQERKFPQSVAAVQAALKTAGGARGNLPILDGFVAGTPDSLDQYQRPFYKCNVSVVSDAAGGSRVRVSAKITAWHNGAKPGYEVLPSNGRLESDLLDRLQQALGSPHAATERLREGDSDAPNNPRKKSSTYAASEPAISAPVPQFPKHYESGGSATPVSAGDAALQKEADGLSEILRNQSHPTNLVAVKKDQTPVLQNPALDAKVLFLASAEDEFEIIESNPDWVHVRISGLSRGWLRRSLVEIWDGSQAATAEQVPANATPAVAAETATASTSAFSISTEENGNFPGDWEPLKGKTVKIVSVQASGQVTSAEQKLQFAEEMFHKETLAATPTTGLVVIFDTEDGGMIAATSTQIAEFKKGAISEEAFWKHCYVDPPEMLGKN